MKIKNSLSDLTLKNHPKIKNLFKNEDLFKKIFVFLLKQKIHKPEQQ